MLLGIDWHLAIQVDRLSATDHRQPSPSSAITVRWHHAVVHRVPSSIMPSSIIAVPSIMPAVHRVPSSIMPSSIIAVPSIMPSSIIAVVSHAVVSHRRSVHHAVVHHRRRQPCRRPSSPFRHIMPYRVPLAYRGSSGIVIISCMESHEMRATQPMKRMTKPI